MSLASLEHEEVEQFTHEFEALFNAGDAAGMASYVTIERAFAPSFGVMSSTCTLSPLPTCSGVGTVKRVGGVVDARGAWAYAGYGL